jgi:hypothetical protein
MFKMSALKYTFQINGKTAETDAKKNENGEKAEAQDTMDIAVQRRTDEATSAEYLI